MLEASGDAGKSLPAQRVRAWLVLMLGRFGSHERI